MNRRGKRPGRETSLSITVISGAIALSAFIAPFVVRRWRIVKSMNICQRNLAAIDAAKEESAMSSNVRSNPNAAMAELVARSSYLSAEPQCPSGAAYRVNAIDVPPECTSGLPGHRFDEFPPATGRK